MTEAQRSAIHDLWDALADFPVSETENALVYLLENISRLVHAGNACWLGAARINDRAPGDILKGFRPRANRYLYPSAVHDEAYRAQVARMYRGEHEASLNLAVRDAGQFRSFRLRQEFPASWFAGEYYQAYRASRGFHDELYVVFPIHADYESYFIFHRVGVRKNFTAADEALAAYTLRGLKWFHRQLALSHGLLLAGDPLTPTQRGVTQLLLTERSEKQIAAEIGKSPHTTHKYVTEIFRKFGVNSRAALMAVWLGQKP